LIGFLQGRKVKNLFARILASTKNGQILFARILASTKNGQILFARILASTKKGQILFARIPEWKNGENPIC
jgi:hypothetical protein